MLEIIFLIFGIIILLWGMYDFFFTALSGSGAGSIAKYFSHGTYKALQMTQSYFGRRIYSFSGLLVNVIVLAVWLLMVWLGLFLIFSSEPEMVTNNSGRIANFWERLYFTAYTLSTLGIGNFAPTTGLAEILTSFFSFFGFIFFTSSMTYFVSVSSAVVNKRTLTRSIHNLGKGPIKIAEKFLDLSPSNSFQQALALQEMIDRHVTNHQSYPVIHFYAHPDPDASLSINLVRLDEAVTIIFHSENQNELNKDLEPLRSSLTNFLHHIEKKFSRSLSDGRVVDSSFEVPYKINSSDDEGLFQRRKFLLGFLESEGFYWQDVFQ